MANKIRPSLNRRATIATNAKREKGGGWEKGLGIRRGYPASFGAVDYCFPAKTSILWTPGQFKAFPNLIQKAKGAPIKYKRGPDRFLRVHRSPPCPVPTSRRKANFVSIPRGKPPVKLFQPGRQPPFPEPSSPPGLIPREHGPAEPAERGPGLSVLPFAKDHEFRPARPDSYLFGQRRPILIRGLEFFHTAEGKLPVFAFKKPLIGR